MASRSAGSQAGGQGGGDSSEDVMSSKKFLFGQAVITELHDKLREQDERVRVFMRAAPREPRIFYPLIYKRRSLGVFRRFLPSCTLVTLPPLAV